MDAPAMVMPSQVPQDVSLRNIGEEGEEQQQHQESKQHKPVLKKVKEKVKKIKNTIASHGHGHDGGEGGNGDDSSTSSEEGGYQEDVEDKPVVEPGPEVHGAPMYETARIPAVQEVEGEDAPRVRLGDLGGPVVEDPAAPGSTTRAPRAGQDIGTTPVVQAFEAMTVSDDDPSAGVGRPEEPKAADTGREEAKEATADAVKGAPAGTTYTEKIKSVAAGTTEYSKKLAATVYDKVADVSTVVAGKVQEATRTKGTATGCVGASADKGDVQDRGVSVTGYIAEKFRPGDDDKALSEAISGSVQQRKEEVGSTVAQRVPAGPGQAVQKAREAVTSLAGGGHRESETLQPTTAGKDMKGEIRVEGQEIGGTGV